MSNIIFDGKQSSNENSNSENNIENKIEKKPVPNLFQGRLDSAIENAKFPTWDIIPPNQFINPRIKKQ